jgi:hypothetical protein
MTVKHAGDSLPQHTAGCTADHGIHDAIYNGLLEDPSKLTEPIRTVEDKYELLPAFLKVSWLVSLTRCLCYCGPKK